MSEKLVSTRRQVLAGAGLAAVASQFGLTTGALAAGPARKLIWVPQALGDWDTAFGFLADDLLIHIPGRSAFAGQRFGKAAAVDYIQSIRGRYRHGPIELDMLCSEERVVLLVRERFHGDGEPIEIRRANVYRVEDHKVVEVSIFEADQYLVDELLH